MVIAFIGFAEKAYKIVDRLPKSTEVWAANHAHKFGFRISRLFELHNREDLENPNYYEDEVRLRHLKFLNDEHDFPVYMHTVGYPAAVEYPLEDALKIAGGKRFASTFAYMAAMAILEKVDRVEIYGFNMDYYETEYRYQKPNALYWIGRMEGAGIVVDSGTLMPDIKLYGYEQAQMVSRHTLEAHQKKYEEQYAKFLKKTEYWKGIYFERSRKGENLNEAAQAVQSFEYSAAQAQGAADAVQHLIDACDLLE